jgi:hypothetical protein
MEPERVAQQISHGGGRQTGPEPQSIWSGANQPIDIGKPQARIGKRSLYHFPIGTLLVPGG